MQPQSPQPPHLQQQPTVQIVPPWMISATFDLPGFRVVQNRGIVRGIVVRSRSVFGTIGASLQTLVGGNITIWSKLCEQARLEAFEIMSLHAAELGANAIIAMRYDATEISAGVTEVLAYGSAVIVEPVR
ncbi:YbjQ family protein [Herpetosiphon sp. NSE202]|uniref:YbjQ family protein n=1 Tax=Herpetosiphon sp. NSE202 TaxID=3351349 RepID=UPI003645595C